MYRYFLISLGFLTAAFPLKAKPTGFQLITGEPSQPTFPDANTSLIQTGSNAIIHWDGFSIDLGETIRFDQLSSNSAILNGGNHTPIIGEEKHDYLMGMGPAVRYLIDPWLTARLDLGFKIHNDPQFTGGRAM